jgi:hypothetical protein
MPQHLIDFRDPASLPHAERSGLRLPQAKIDSGLEIPPSCESILNSRARAPRAGSSANQPRVDPSAATAEVERHRKSSERPILLNLIRIKSFGLRAPVTELGTWSHSKS